MGINISYLVETHMCRVSHSITGIGMFVNDSLMGLDRDSSESLSHECNITVYCNWIRSQLKRDDAHLRHLSRCSSAHQCTWRSPVIFLELPSTNLKFLYLRIFGGSLSIEGAQPRHSIVSIWILQSCNISSNFISNKRNKIEVLVRWSPVHYELMEITSLIQDTSQGHHLASFAHECWKHIGSSQLGQRWSITGEA